jgi:hypothetical protein
MVLWRRTGVLCAALNMVLGATALGQVPRPGQGSSRPAEARGPVTAPVFEFHSGFWFNLHHFLYQQARIRDERPVRIGSLGNPPGDAAASVAPAADSASLTAEERRAWDAALDYYTSALARRDLLFDSGMVLIKNRLAELRDAPDMSLSGLRQEMNAALEAAAPVYRRHWWLEHDRANRRWIAMLVPRVERLGSQLATRLAKAYQSDWPAEPVTVDVAVYAGRVGGYTSLDPLHVTVSSSDPRNQDLAALEILFHEASHGLARTVAEAIARECRQRNKPIPRDLWHAVLFYTTGEMVRRALIAEQISDYLPYAYRHGLYTRGWQNYQALLERHWQPYLDGRIDFDRAMARMASAL